MAAVGCSMAIAKYGPCSARGITKAVWENRVNDYRSEQYFLSLLLEMKDEVMVWTPTARR